MAHGPYIHFGEKITNRRRLLGLTVKAAAHELNVARPMLSRWENGHEMPRHQNYRKLLDLGLLEAGDEEKASFQLLLPFDRPENFQVMVTRKSPDSIQLELRVNKPAV